MASIIHRIGIQAPLSDVYAALSTISGLSGWWTRETSGLSKPGGLIEFHFRDEAGNLKGSFKMEVMRLESDGSVHWRVQEGPPDWVGTELTFELKQEGEYVIVLFGHRKWQEATESMAHCSMKWATFLLSLRDYLERGQGRPAPKDLKIDNWN